MPAMSAEVEEPTQSAGVVTREQDRFAANPYSASCAGTHEAFGSTEANPRRLEELAHLPGE
jgi:hypothetical protein